VIGIFPNQITKRLLQRFLAKNLQAVLINTKAAGGKLICHRKKLIDNNFKLERKAVHNCATDPYH
jgi:hypothetical protein